MEKNVQIKFLNVFSFIVKNKLMVLSCYFYLSKNILLFSYSS